MFPLPPDFIMSHLEDLKPNASVQGIMPSGLVTVVSVQWHRSEALELTYKTAEGKVTTNCSIATTSHASR